MASATISAPYYYPPVSAWQQLMSYAWPQRQMPELPPYPTIMPDVQYMLDTNYSGNWPLWMQWAQDLGAGAWSGLNYAVDKAMERRANGRERQNNFWQPAEKNLAEYYGDEW